MGWAWACEDQESDRGGGRLVGVGDSAASGGRDSRRRSHSRSQGGPWWCGSAWNHIDGCWGGLFVISCLGTCWACRIPRPRAARLWKQGRQALAWQLFAHKGALKESADKGKAAAALDVAEFQASEDGGAHWVDVATQPRTIYHALHRTFDELQAMLPQLAAAGFDAVQLPPAQVSPPGNLRSEWYLRYQPLRYSAVDPLLGGEGSLEQLCAAAALLGMQVIADCVFNHGAVVASKAEWEAAQSDTKLLEELKCRLDRAFAPELSREDFQWPWVCLEGGRWDDPSYTYEGWGCGEWSEFRFCEHVVQVHIDHLRRLLHCGVRGFRLDAAKHMRPAHVQRYVDFLQREGAFIYTEVLSMDRGVHAQYEALGHGLQAVRSTDYILAKQLRDACRSPEHGSGSPPLLARLAAISNGALGPGAVRFVRSHDTALNKGPAICGIDWLSAEDAKLAWAFLLAAPEGTVLVYEEDATVLIVQRAVAFRRALAQRASLLSIDSQVGDGMGDLEFDLGALPPTYDPVVLLVRQRSNDGGRGAPLGLVMLSFNPQRQAQELQKSRRPSRSPSRWWQMLSSSAAPALPPLPWDLGDGVRLSEVLGGQLQADGTWRPRLATRGDAGQATSEAVRFFLVDASRGDDTPRGDLDCTSESLVLHYRSGWTAPHLHFGTRGKWTAAPGWPFRRAPEPTSSTGAGGSAGPSGSWWTVQVPLAKGQGPIEFVLNDGGGCWDQPPGGGNYKAGEPGNYILEKGFLRRQE